jgi:hypothetical protein
MEPQFFAKAAHVRIDRPRVNCAAVSPDLLEQFVTGLNRASLIDEQGEQSEFSRSQVDPLPVKDDP